MRQWTESARVQVMACYQAITWTNADSLSTQPLGTNLSQISIEKQNLSFMKMQLYCLPRTGGHFVNASPCRTHCMNHKPREPLHQQAWYWPPEPEYSVPGIKRVNDISYVCVSVYPYTEMDAICNTLFAIYIAVHFFKNRHTWRQQIWNLVEIIQGHRFCLRWDINTPVVQTTVVVFNIWGSTGIFVVTNWDGGN